MFGSRSKTAELERKVSELLRVQRMQGEAHSAIMNQVAAIHSKLDDLGKRISFYNRPKP